MIRTGCCVSVSDSSFEIAALVVYEYIATIPRVHQTMWTQKWTGATWFFWLNRYQTLAFVIIWLTPLPVVSVCRA